MKNVSTLSLPITILAFVLLLSACKEDKKKILAQRWKIQDVKLSEEVPAEQKEFFAEMLTQMKQYLRITYNIDGTYEANMMGNISKGKWEISKDGKELTASDETNKPMKYKIVSLTKDKFEYMTDDAAKPVTFVLVPGDSVSTPPPMPSQDMMQEPTTAMPEEEATKK